MKQTCPTCGSSVEVSSMLNTNIKSGKITLNDKGVYQFGSGTPANHKILNKWVIVWDDPVNGLTNLSLPIHPDFLYDDGDLMSFYFEQLKEGSLVRFIPVVYNDIFGYYDCAKLLVNAHTDEEGTSGFVPSKTYRWVKASERLPVYVKKQYAWQNNYPTTYVSVRADGLFFGALFDHHKKIFRIREAPEKLYWGEDVFEKFNIEWLEEIPSTPIVSAKEVRDICECGKLAKPDGSHYCKDCDPF